MFKRLVIATLLLGLVVGGIVWFNHFRAQMIAQFFAGMTPAPVPVSTETVEPVTWRSGVDAIGTALSAQGVDLAVEAPGLVREVKFTANDIVIGRQHLVQIDERSELAQRTAAEAALSHAVAELERARTLQERGISTATTVDVAETQAASARAQLAQVQALLEQKELRAPFEGMIGIPRIEVGQYVTPGMVYATLQNLKRMLVDFTVPEQQIGYLRMGSPVNASTEVGDLSATGRITAIEPQVDPGSRMVTVRAEVDNADGTLYPGQFLRVRIELPEEEGVIALPQTVVSSNLYGDTVFVIREGEGDGEDEALTVEQVFVTVGRRSGGRVEIVAGVEAGEQVVTAGQNRLTNGAAVVIDNTVAPPASLGE